MSERYIASGSAVFSPILNAGVGDVGPITTSHFERYYSGGVVLDHSNPSIVYLSRQVHGHYEIEKWTTPNEGYTWRHTTVVRTPGADDIPDAITLDSNSSDASSIPAMQTLTAVRTSWPAPLG